MRRLLSRKGQSVLEYVIVLTAIVAGVVLASTALKNKISKSLGTEGAAGYIENKVEEVFD